MTEDLTAIEVDQFYPHPPAKVWRALTTPELMGQWLMEPDGFEPVLGCRFSMRAKPIPAVNFSGEVACEVLDVIEAERLQISWADATAADPADWRITWSLHPEGRGTRVLLRHSGFDPDDPLQQLSRRMMGGGWPTVARNLGKALDAI
ncbi:SRPBCC domain-containing protein [Nocardia sp. NPDC051321]|uniref:SRPBCC domain-containing protein n=1 Tax=Nocardia sp. NPDC051321 TaxID=3364323 RepID=UPI0037B5D5B8